jgi:adenylate cyclase
MKVSGRPLPVVIGYIAMLGLTLLLLGTNAAGLHTELQKASFAGYQTLTQPDSTLNASGAAATAEISSVLPTPHRPVIANEVEYFCLFFLAALGLSVFTRHGPNAAALFTVCIAAGLFFVSWRIYADESLFLDATGPAIGLALAWLGGIGGYYYRCCRDRAKIEHVFGGRLSQIAVRKLLHRPDILIPKGECRLVTCLSSGISNYGKLAANRKDDPAGFSLWLQQRLEPMIDEVLRRGGMVIGTNGGEMTAVWNAPLDDTDAAIHACAAASGMLRACAADKKANAPFGITIGIATSPCIAGSITIHDRTIYSAVGDCISTAAHLRHIAARYGQTVIVGQDIRDAADASFAFLEVDFLHECVAGDAVRLYALQGDAAMRASPRFRATATFQDHIFQAIRSKKWNEARELIAQCRKLSGACQELYDLHAARIVDYEKNPPAENWDGAFRPSSPSKPI